MCVIIAKPAGVKRLDPKYFDKAWDRNPDGGGLVWKKPGEEVFFQKGYMNKQDCLMKIDEKNQDDSSFIAHFRIRSVGAVCADNTHPFVMDHVTYAHNGTLHITPLDGKTDSETFGLAFLKDKTMDWIKEYKVLLEMALGTSKFAIMDNETGEILILNEDLGKTRDDAWFSNDSPFPVAPVPATTSNYKSYYDGYDYNSNSFNFGTQIKGLATFGTKQFVREYARLNKDNVWVYNYSDQPVAISGYSNCCLHKRGFVFINPTIKVPEDAVNKKYGKGSKEIRVMDAYTRQLYKDVKKYHKTTFGYRFDREEAEYELSAMYTVIRAMRMFVVAGKAIDDKEFLSFLLDNTEPKSWVSVQQSESAYQEYVKLYAEEVLKKLESAEA